MKRLTVIGGGTLARAAARIVTRAKTEVRLWARNPDKRQRLADRLAAAHITGDLAEACDGATMILVAVPASGFREVVTKIGEVATADQVLLHAVRGVCPSDGLVLPHTVVRQETCLRKIAVLGGPLYTPDLKRNRPLAAVLASRFDEAFDMVRALTEGTPVILHRSRDVPGVEVAGIMSNVSALAVGMAKALRLGNTVRGMLLTHGLSEAARLGVALGAEPGTYAGLAGVGDLIPRNVESTDRHHRVGVALASGSTLEEALAVEPGEVEGVLNARKVVAATDRRGLELPLARAVDDVCTASRGAEEAIEDVLRRDLELGVGLRS